ncbi:MAG: tRNA pseudouridine(55) synthase TruB [Bacteroidota bacterium]
MKTISKNRAVDIEPDFASGEVILLDKKLRKSSFDYVYKVRKTAGVKKVGHAGTLDPMATGLMIICTGRMTKEISKIQDFEKTYTGIFTLGKTTPSFDSETEFDSHEEKSFEHITEEEIYRVRDLFMGNIAQTPPMYSAVKHNGKALYHYARKGVEVERRQRKVFISKFEITKIDLPDIHFEISCSKGTYIRVIANDFGKQLGCGAFLKELRRTRIGSYSVDDALEIEEFQELVKNYSLVISSKD